MKKLTLYILLIAASLAGCRGKTQAWDTLSEAESLIESQPDSALTLLSAIDKSHLGDREERARYALLMSMALDKNYIDTTSFAVLQPAIDYYLKHGTPDEKLRTLYYQACIYRNRGDDGNTMASCIEALNLEGVTDTLVLARTLVGQGALYDKQYKIAEFAENNIQAAKLYQSAGHFIPAIRCYAKALNVTVILENKNRCDSLVKICLSLSDKYPETKELVDGNYLSYLIDYGTDIEFLNLVEKLHRYNLPNHTKLDIARGYIAKGEKIKALQMLDSIGIESTTSDSLKYYAVTSEIYELANDPAKALDAYKKYMYVAERFHVRMFNNDLLFAEKKHQLEIGRLIEVQGKKAIIRYCLIAIIILLLFAIIILYRYFRIRTRRILTEKENLQLRVEQENLKELLQEQKELTEPIQHIIKQRLNLLNSLLAKEISDNEAHAVPYRQWIEHIRKNKEEFMNSTRLAFSASHPTFMNYLAAHSLTEDEINYVCLYAIGLKGKEVGEYLQLKSHYNISSTIRRKLGIDEHETNIGLYIRRRMNEPNTER